MMKTIAILSAVAGLALTASVPAFGADETPAAAPAAKRSCFFASQINGWGSERDDKTAYLYVGVKDVYRADLFAPCDDLDNAVTIGVETRGGGSSICDGMDVELLVRSSIGPRRCLVNKLTKLTPEEVKAMRGGKKSGG